MASYATDPRTGLLIVTQDDGTQLPGMMPEMAPQFDAMGMTRYGDGPSHASAPSDGGGGNALDMGPPPTSVPGPGQPPLSHAFEGFAPAPPGAPMTPGQAAVAGGAPMTSGQAAVAGALGEAPSHPGQPRAGIDPNDFNRDPLDSFSGKPPRNKLADPTAPTGRAGAQATDVPLDAGADQGGGGGRGGGGSARYVDVPLSPLRTTSRQVTHDRRDALTEDERAQRKIPLAEQLQRLGFAERRDKLNRDTALLNDEKRYYAEMNLLQQEEAKQNEINNRTRLMQIERDNLDKEAREASVDPKRYFRDMSIWTKIVAAVSAGLQGYQGGMTGQGGMPPVIGLLQDLNKQDIEDQKLKMESAVARGKLANDRYEQALKLWGDPDAAEMQMERDKLALVDGWLARQAAAQQADAAASEAFATARQQIQERLVTLDDELSLWGKAQVVDQMQATPQRLVGGGGGGGARAAKPDPTQRRSAQETISNLQTVVEGMDRIEALEAEGKYAEAEALGNALIAPYSQATGSGQPQGGERETFLEEVFGDPGSRVYRHVPGTTANTGKQRRSAVKEDLQNRISKQQQLLQFADPDAPSTQYSGVAGERR
jgi:hypothetical protein